MTPDGPQPLLELRRVRFAYGHLPVLDDVDLRLPPGSTTALIGPSGCGKSTLVAIAAGLLAPGSGEVRCNARRPAIVFQDPRLLPWRSARDNVAFALKARRTTSAMRGELAERALETVGLAAGDMAKFPRQLSGGMRQRTALARALVIAPDLLLLDEPFTALDPDLAQRMHALVRDYVRDSGAAALIVTHDACAARVLADRTVVLTPSAGLVEITTRRG